MKILTVVLGFLFFGNVSPQILSQPCPLVCVENEVFTECTLGEFQPNCWNRHIWFDRTTISCSPGCECKAGFVRDPDTYKCIDIRTCPKTPANGICPRNEFWSSCGFRCDKSCAFIDNRDLLCRSCVEGCICRNGFVRSQLTGQCIPEKDCNGENEIEFCI